MDKADKKNLDVFGRVITSIATDAASEAEGVKLVAAGRSAAVSAGFLPNERVTVDLNVVIEFNRPVPNTVAALQERVKTEIERATKFKVHSVNVNVAGILPETRVGN